MDSKTFTKHLRKGSRAIHRDLSFFFSGVIIVYAVSGFVMNHKKDFNSDYIVRQYEITAPGTFPISKDEASRQFALSLLEPLGESANYTHHYFPDEDQLKIFIKGGSSVTLSLRSGKGTYESFKRRHVISAFNRLHYNPNRWWTIFADIFAAGLIIITLTGLVMNSGSKGLRGRGGIELAAGIVVPLLFMLLT